MQYQEGQRLRGPNGEDGIFQNGHIVVLSPAPVVTRPADPRLPAQTTIAANQAAASAVDPAQAAANLEATNLQNAQRRLIVGNHGLTPEQHASLTAQMDSLGTLERGINEVESLYQQGFQGSAGGIMGMGGSRNLAGRLPNIARPINERFEAASNRLMSAIAAAQGLSAQQQNTPTELRIRFGPMLPQPTDNDATIEDKIRGLRALLENQRTSISHQLGVTPMGQSGQTPATLPPGSAPPGEQPDRTTATVTADTGSGMALSHGGVQADPSRAAMSAQVRHRISTMMKNGTPDAEIAAYAQSVGVAPMSVGNALAWRRGERVPGVRGTWQEWRRQRPNEEYPLRDDAINVPMTPLASTAAAAASSGPATGLVNAADAVFPLSLSGAALGLPTEPTRLGLEATGAEHPAWALGGRLAGATAAYAGGGKLADMAGGALEASMPRIAAALRPARGYTALTPRAVAGDALYGAIQGQGENGDPLSGVAENVGGGMFGRMAVRGAGRTLSGTRDAATRYLTGRGFPLTVGQIAGQGGRLGRVVESVENTATSIPGLGPVINAQRAGGIKRLNTATFEDVLHPIGGTQGGQTAELAVEDAQRQISDAYSSALSGVDLPRDSRISADLAALRARAARIPTIGKDISYILRDNIDPLFVGGRLNGPNFQAALQTVKQAIPGYSGVPLGNQATQVLRDTEKALMGLARRHAPDAVPELNAANTAYRRFTIARNAVNTSINNMGGGGEFTPAQLGRQARQGTINFGGRTEAATTRRPFFELQRNAQQVLPNSYPDSGTAGRLLYPALAMGLGGGAGAGSDAAGWTDHGTEIGLGLGALSLPYTNTGRAGLQALMARRLDAMRALGDRTLQSGAPRVGGMFGSTATGYESGRQ